MSGEVVKVLHLLDKDRVFFGSDCDELAKDFDLLFFRCGLFGVGHARTMTLVLIPVDIYFQIVSFVFRPLPAP